MGTAAGLVIGDMVRAGRSFLAVVAEVIGVIFTAWFTGSFLNTTVVSYTTNSAITACVSFNLTDLAIALTCGAAGVFAMSRSDVADSLPGVAISVSLVPPLCVVGIGLSGGERVVALGAMLLFLTDFFSRCSNHKSLIIRQEAQAKDFGEKTQKEAVKCKMQSIPSHWA